MNHFMKKNEVFFVQNSDFCVLSFSLFSFYAPSLISQLELLFTLVENPPKRLKQPQNNVGVATPEKPKAKVLTREEKNIKSMTRSKYLRRQPWELRETFQKFSESLDESGNSEGTRLTHIARATRPPMVQPTWGISEKPPKIGEGRSFPE